METTQNQDDLDLGSVLASMANWQKARTNASQLTALFKNVAYFLLELDGVRNEYGMHFYPGVDREGNLEGFAISVCDDRPGTGMIENCISRCSVIPLVESDDLLVTAISKQEALDRIQNWKEYYPEWIKQAVAEKGNLVFSSFYIPGDDFPADSRWQIFFPGLYAAEPGGKWVPDLIVAVNDGTVMLEDTVRPVPPFKPYGKLSMDSFYLLNICLELNGSTWSSMTSSTI